PKASLFSLPLQFFSAQLSLVCSFSLSRQNNFLTKTTLLAGCNEPMNFLQNSISYSTHKSIGLLLYIEDITDWSGSYFSLLVLEPALRSKEWWGKHSKYCMGHPKLLFSYEDIC
ncbi:hypothetical protein V8G54_018382, partial [Vigna mungo]